MRGVYSQALCAAPEKPFDLNRSRHDWHEEDRCVFAPRTRTTATAPPTIRFCRRFPFCSKLSRGPRLPLHPHQQHWPMCVCSTGSRGTGRSTGSCSRRSDSPQTSPHQKLQWQWVGPWCPAFGVTDWSAAGQSRPQRLWRGSANSSSAPRRRPIAHGDSLKTDFFTSSHSCRPKL